MLATWCEELTHRKRPWCWERLKAGGEGDDKGWDGWRASPTQLTWVCANSGRWWRTWKPGCCSPWGSKELDMTERLNWTDWTERRKVQPLRKTIWLFLIEFNTHVAYDPVSPFSQYWSKKKENVCSYGDGWANSHSSFINNCPKLEIQQVNRWTGRSLHPVGPLLFIVQLLSCVQLFVTTWTAACQASLSFTIS